MWPGSTESSLRAGTAGSSSTIPTDAARSFNGSGRRSDKAETKVRLLLGLLERNTKRVREMVTLQRWKRIHQTTHGVVV